MVLKEIRDYFEEILSISIKRTYCSFSLIREEQLNYFPPKLRSLFSLKGLQENLALYENFILLLRNNGTYHINRACEKLSRPIKIKWWLRQYCILIGK